MAVDLATLPADELIENRVARSGIITLDLEELYNPLPRLELDLAPWLWQGMVLREKDFRDAVAGHDWAQYAGAAVAVHCSAEALVQAWAYMIVGTKLAGVAAYVHHGTLPQLEEALYLDAIANFDVGGFAGAKVVVKGCADVPVPDAAYTAIALRLAPVVISLMFGEACSAVPVFKRRREAVANS